MENSFGSLISTAKSVLVLLPTDLNLDTVAAGLAVSLSLPQENVVSSDSPMLVEFNRLVGVQKIRKDLGNKNLTLKFAGYKADNIEKVSYDIVNSEFRLTIVPKIGTNAPKQEQVEYSYSGVSADLIILVGGQDKNTFPALKQKELQGVKMVHVGVRSLESQDILEFSRPAAAVSEVIAHLIKENGLAIDPDIATNLVAGIEDGSKHFTHPYVNADTFALIADLMRAGGRRSTDQLDRTQFPAGSIPGEMIQQPQHIQEVGAIEEVETENAPQSWFEAPQIYKGTSVS